MIVHPEFNTLTKQNDIALIRLSERAKINQNNIKAICLPLRSELEKLPPLLIVIGFGRTESSKSNSDVLLKVSVRTVSNDECVAQYENTSLRLIEKQFCAGSEFELRSEEIFVNFLIFRLERQLRRRLGIVNSISELLRR
jgi:hypothetical protein